MLCTAVGCIILSEVSILSNTFTLSTQSNFNGLFHSLFWIKRKRSIGVKGLIKDNKKHISFAFRPDYISPLDDLAFDMYQDPEIAGIIRKLEKKKQEAVLRKKI